MKILIPLATAVILSAAVLPTQAACMRCAPIQNVTDAPVPTENGKPMSNDEVRKSIVRAGASLGWQMTAAGPGKISGTLVLRSHTAVVEIPYSPKSYSIVYKSSVNLDESEGQIHKNYNSWIQNLDKAIKVQLAASAS